jgi:hypothetical protein
MKLKLYSLAGLFLLGLFNSGCSTVEPAQHFGNVPLESYKSAYVVFSKDTTIGGYIAADLAQRGIKASVGTLQDEPKDVGFYVTYVDHWNWDVAVYLDSLEVQFIDNSNGQIVASGFFRNSKVLESWPNPRTKTFEVIDSMFGAKPAK